MIPQQTSHRCSSGLARPCVPTLLDMRQDLSGNSLGLAALCFACLSGPSQPCDDYSGSKSSRSNKPGPSAYAQNRGLLWFTRVVGARLRWLPSAFVGPWLSRWWPLLWRGPWPACPATSLRGELARSQPQPGAVSHSQERADRQARALFVSLSLSFFFMQWVRAFPDRTVRKAQKTRSGLFACQWPQDAQRGS